ncbi:M91 family zinc metallopeptidase [Flavobacterium amniphilum]|nr:M91 family zinc metallopeptidase [Flavobacterium amniphilum]
MEAFELRLWDGRLGRWLTVDPMKEFHSPYVGMGNNPMKYIDINGGEIVVNAPNVESYTYRDGELYSMTDKKVYSGNDPFLIEMKKSIRTLELSDAPFSDSVKRGPGIITATLIKDMIDSKNEQYGINYTDQDNYTSGDQIFINPNLSPSISSVKKGMNKYDEKLKRKRPTVIAVAHELGHAFDNMNKVSSRKPWYEYESNEEGKPNNVMSNQERFASAVENMYRGRLNLELRNFYDVTNSKSLLINQLFQSIWIDSNGNEQKCDCGN